MAAGRGAPPEFAADLPPLGAAPTDEKVRAFLRDLRSRTGRLSIKERETLARRALERLAAVPGVEEPEVRVRLALGLYGGGPAIFEENRKELSGFEPARVLTLREFLDTGMGDPPPTVVPRLAFANRVSLLASREKDGKSTLAMAAAAAKSSGARFLGEYVDPGPVLVVQLDEPLGDSARKLVRFGADPDLVLVTDHIGTEPVEAIRRLVAQVDPALVVVDSLARLGHAAGVRDVFGSVEWIALLAPLADLAHRGGPGVLLLHHSRKVDGEYRDSTAIGAIVDGILTMHPTGDRERQVAVRARWPAEVFTVQLCGDLADTQGALWFDLVRGELSLDARVLLYIENNPGCSRHAVERSVVGRASAIRAAIDTLIRRGVVEDRGSESTGSRLFVVHGGRATDEPRDEPPSSAQNPHGQARDEPGTNPGTRGVVPPYREKGGTNLNPEQVVDEFVAESGGRFWRVEDDAGGGVKGPLSQPT